MGMRRFLARVFGFETQPVCTPSADPLQLAAADALLLVDAMFHGQPWARRAWERRMGETRWERATDLLRSVDIVDRKGRCLLPMGYRQFEAEVLVREAANRARARQRYKNYVSPRG